MVVMPAFAESEHSDPKAVFGSVASGEPLRSPHVRGRVHQPRSVQTKDRAEEDAPHHILPAAESKYDQPQYADGNPMPFADPYMETTFAQVGNIRQKLLGLVVHRFPRNDPARMCPEASIARRMWISFFIGILVMHPVRRDPCDGPAFQRQRAADGEKIFNPLWGLVSTMSKQPVVAHTNAEAPGDPPQ